MIDQNQTLRVECNRKSLLSLYPYNEIWNLTFNPSCTKGNTSLCLDLIHVVFHTQCVPPGETENNAPECQSFPLRGSLYGCWPDTCSWQIVFCYSSILSPASMLQELLLTDPPMWTSSTNTSPWGQPLDKLQSCQAGVEVLDAHSA